MSFENECAALVQVASLPIQADGSLAPAADVQRHGVDGGPAAHAHSVVFCDGDPDMAFVSDLGLDQVRCASSPSPPLEALELHACGCRTHTVQGRPTNRGPGPGYCWCRYSQSEHRAESHNLNCHPYKTHPFGARTNPGAFPPGQVISYQFDAGSGAMTRAGAGLDEGLPSLPPSSFYMENPYR